MMPKYLQMHISRLILVFHCKSAFLPMTDRTERS
ncbi:hypothetical protein IEO21_08507 [Rhodonia placenta]|uniref:Uncharacterized protein n=1 Tax=Rhodonia placenta TaxID=104341 RepID=A0A8H7NW12_9APHY|nr:hypothetical protein IEO21_08507 [Postia placenta]